MEMACCGLKATEQSFIDAGIPVPAQSQIIYHDPALACTCDALLVCIGGSRNTSEQRNLDPFGAPARNLPNACVVQTREISIDICVTRCVHVENPLTGTECWDNVDCAEVIRCPDDPPLPRPSSMCDTAPKSKAEETAWLLEDRWILETVVPMVWSKCLCEGWCGPDGCGLVGCGGSVQWVESNRFDSGTCGGTVATYLIT